MALISGCVGGGSDDPRDESAQAICSELADRTPGLSGDVLVQHRPDQSLSEAVEAARELCAEDFPTSGDLVFAPIPEVVLVTTDCRLLARAIEDTPPTAQEVIRLEKAANSFGDSRHLTVALATDSECTDLPLGFNPTQIYTAARDAYLCSAVTAVEDVDRTHRERRSDLDDLLSLSESRSDETFDAAVGRCSQRFSDAATFSATLTEEINELAADAAAAVAEAAEQKQRDTATAEVANEEASRQAADSAEQERRARINPSLLRCYDAYYEAQYLSAAAQQAATCIVDNLFFGGVTPSTANTSELIPEMLFHATWATWDSSTRLTYCLDVKRRGFDAAERYGIAMAEVWQSQIRASGSAWQLDDYGLVLDLLDTCERY